MGNVVPLRCNAVCHFLTLFVVLYLGPGFLPSFEDFLRYILCTLLGNDQLLRWNLAEQRVLEEVNKVGGV